MKRTPRPRMWGFCTQPDRSRPLRYATRSDLQPCRGTRCLSNDGDLGAPCAVPGPHPDLVFAERVFERRGTSDIMDILTVLADGKTLSWLQRSPMQVHRRYR